MAIETLSLVVMVDGVSSLIQRALDAAERIAPGTEPGALAAIFTLEALRRLRVYDGDGWKRRVLGHLHQAVSPADVTISADLTGLAAKRSNVITRGP